MKEPAILAISPPHARLANERLSGFKRRAPFGHNWFYIFRMDHAAPTPPQQICQRDADIFQPAAVVEVDFTIRQSGVNKRRSCIYQIAILSLASTQLPLSPLTLGDVDHSSYEFHEIAARAENWMAHDANVPDGATCMQDAVFRFKAFLRTDGPLRQFTKPRSIVGMDRPKESFGLRQTI